MSLFEALMILALISLVAAAGFSGVIRFPASLALDREISRLKANMAIAARRAQSFDETQIVELAYGPPMIVDNCEGGEAPKLFFKPNGDVSAATFCMSVREEKARFRTDWLTGHLIREEGQ